MEEQQQFMRSYTRKEVSEKTKVGMSTLIDWETVYGDVLVIPRNEKNERFYTDFEINILNNIKTMRKQKLAHGLIKEMIKKAKEENAQHEVAASVVPIPSVPVMTAHEAIENMLKLERTVEKAKIR
ncbi:MerR family transcriptional regulator [Ectobacillus funiculus]